MTKWLIIINDKKEQANKLQKNIILLWHLKQFINFFYYYIKELCVRSFVTYHIIRK